MSNQFGGLNNIYRGTEPSPLKQRAAWGTLGSCSFNLSIKYISKTFYFVEFESSTIKLFWTFLVKLNYICGRTIKDHFCLVGKVYDKTISQRKSNSRSLNWLTYFDAKTITPKTRINKETSEIELKEKDMINHKAKYMDRVWSSQTWENDFIFHFSNIFHYKREG